MRLDIYIFTYTHTAFIYVYIVRSQYSYSDSVPTCYSNQKLQSHQEKTTNSDKMGR